MCFYLIYIFRFIFDLFYWHWKEFQFRRAFVVTMCEKLKHKKIHFDRVLRPACFCRGFGCTSYRFTFGLKNYWALSLGALLSVIPFVVRNVCAIYLLLNFMIGLSSTNKCEVNHACFIYLLPVIASELDNKSDLMWTAARRKKIEQ